MNAGSFESALGSTRSLQFLTQSLHPRELLPSNFDGMFRLIYELLRLITKSLCSVSQIGGFFQLSSPERHIFRTSANSSKFTARSLHNRRRPPE